MGFIDLNTIETVFYVNRTSVFKLLQLLLLSLFPSELLLLKVLAVIANYEMPANIEK